MINVVLVMLAASTFMLNPPTRVSWGYAELHPSGDEQAQKECGGLSDAVVFSARAWQVATDSLSKEQRVAYDDLVERLEREWADASRSERAGFFLELSKIASAKNTRTIEQTWVELDSVMVHYLKVLDMPSGNLLETLEDETTGQYVAVLSESGGEIDRADLMTRFFEAGFTQEELKAAFMAVFQENGATTPDVNEEAVKILMQIKKDADETTVRVEVNGVARVFDHDPQVRHRQVQESIAELWQHLPEGAGRRRIETAISVIRRAVEHETAEKEEHIAGSIIDLSHYFDDAPEETCLSADAAITVFQKGGSMIDLQAPPTEIIDVLFGEQGLPLPDPNLSFKRLKKELL